MIGEARTTEDTSVSQAAVGNDGMLVSAARSAVGVPRTAAVADRAQALFP